MIKQAVKGNGLITSTFVQVRGMIIFEINQKWSGTPYCVRIRSGLCPDKPLWSPLLSGSLASRARTRRRSLGCLTCYKTAGWGSRPIIGMANHVDQKKSRAVQTILLTRVYARVRAYASGAA